GSRALSSAAGLLGAVAAAQHHGDLSLVGRRVAGGQADDEGFLAVGHARGAEHDAVRRALQLDAAGGGLVADDVDHLAAALGRDVVAADDDPAVPVGAAGAGLAVDRGAHGDPGPAPDRFRP